MDSPNSTHRDVLEQLMARAQEEMDVLKRKVAQVQNVSEDLEINYKNLGMRIRESFDVLAKSLLQQKDCLLDELETSFMGELLLGTYCCLLERVRGVVEEIRLGQSFQFILVTTYIIFLHDKSNDYVKGPTKTAY